MGKIKLTSQQELAIWQPAWPTILQKLASSTRCIGRPRCGEGDAFGGERGGGLKGAFFLSLSLSLCFGGELARTVDANNLTHGERFFFLFSGILKDEDKEMVECKIEPGEEKEKRLLLRGSRGKRW